MAYIPAISMPRTTLEAIRLRILKIRSGMIGFSMRDSQVKNAASSASATAPKPSTWIDVQPWAVAWTIAGLRTEKQKELLGRYRMASAAERQFVRDSLRAHVTENFPELQAP